MISKNLVNLGGVFLAALLLPATLANSQSSLPAFPGAQGGGAASIGGAGGTVMLVTNLNDDGPGSLRACAVEASGPRTCIFRISGIIELASTLYITNPYLTIAGQTAPGGGIELSGRTMCNHVLTIAAHDVIMRYMRVRHGFYNSQCGGMNISTEVNAYNVVIDHNSSSWSNGDDNDGGDQSRDPSTYTLNNETWSWNLFAEPLSAHSTNFVFSCTQSATPAWCDWTTDIDLHHNLFMTADHRNPYIEIQSGRFINNIVYNVGSFYSDTDPSVTFDFINNKYVPGPLTAAIWGSASPSGLHEIQIPAACGAAGECPDTSVTSLWLSGNIGPNQSNPNGNQWQITALLTGVAGTSEAQSPVPTANQAPGPLPVSYPYPIIPDLAANLDTVILPTVGASQTLACDGTWVSNRDSVDARLISEYQSNTGINFLPTSENAVGGYPTIAAGSPCTMTIPDGIPDVWKIANGLNPNGPSMANAIAPNGYTYLENYLNGPSSSIAGLPDVAATSLSYDSATGLFTSVVTNISAVPTPAGVYVGNGFYVDGNFVSWGSVMGPLAPGASVTINSSGGGAYTIPAGTHTITVIANDYSCCGRFPESDKPSTTASDSNNTLSQTISIPVESTD
jgi:hypothetical protein